MNADHHSNPPDSRPSLKWKRITDNLLKVGAIFILLEPIWMLLPFAGFLYGSVMHIQLLRNNPHTAWLVDFVFPVHTFFPLGLILITAGIAVFLIGAFQIYAAKLLKRGLVKNGIYSKFRNPQYIALTFFGIGILLTWGRFITYISFFIMMWLYYYLAKSEERKCLALFGNAYQTYRRRTCFLFPGEQRLRSFFQKLPGADWPQWAKAPLSFALVLSIAIGSGLLIQATKTNLRHALPTTIGSIELSNPGKPAVRLVMVKGPALQAAPFEHRRKNFMDKAYEMIISSPKIKKAVDNLDINENQTLVAFLVPGSNWYSRHHHDEAGTVKINAFLVLAENAASLYTNPGSIQGEEARILKIIKAHDLSYDRLMNKQDPTEGEVRVSGPPIGVTNASFQKNVEDRIRFFSSGF